MENKTKLILLWFILVFTPLFTLRLFQDEMLYLDASRKVTYLEFLPRSSLVFVLTSPLMVFENVDLRVFLPRIATSVIILLDLLLIYKLAKRYYGEKAGFLSSLMFLFSFVVLRYGARYTLEPWGVFFVLLAVYYFDEKPLLAALSIGLAFCARETWLTTYPFFLAYAWRRNRKEFSKILLVSAIPITLNFLFIASINLYKSPLSYNARDALDWGVSNIVQRLLRGWLEFAVGYILIVVGFIYGVKKDKTHKDFLLLVLPSLITLNGVNGFILNGPFERYTFGPLALMSIFSGYGIIELYNSLKTKIGFLKILSVEKWVVSFLIAQFILFNVAVIELSDIGAKGIHDYGYWYDREVFRILRENADPDEFFVGTPHPALLGFKNWKWADRNIQKAVDLDPDWLITFESWVNFKENPDEIKELEIYSVGPYLIIHAKEKGAIKQYVVSSDLKLWKFRK
ncbi:glycosyltransferase family 39 protein [Thermococcus sp.]|uniref:ArnT family glycosyltransferase n=1 Tax=Thermococcus sp. TaxID=35749 RepID=UPI0019C504E0|nr:glycosyltransferase family 39 protein [Thermococcus sp.]MBC7095416.1 glycosyltransferase family 39 protein [Thermococcus sp.]